MRRDSTILVAMLLTLSLTGINHACCIGRLSPQPEAARKCCQHEPAPTPAAPQHCQMCKLQIDLKGSPTLAKAPNHDLLAIAPLEPSSIGSFPTQPVRQSFLVLISPVLTDLFHTHCLLTT
jgi:hypothetical protein